MNNTVENLDQLTYQMTDEEIIKLRETVLESNKKRYGIVNREDVSDDSGRDRTAVPRKVQI